MSKVEQARELAQAAARLGNADIALWGAFREHAAAVAAYNKASAALGGDQRIPYNVPDGLERYAREAEDDDCD